MLSCSARSSRVEKSAERVWLMSRTSSADGPARPAGQRAADQRVRGVRADVDAARPQPRDRVDVGTHEAAVHHAEVQVRPGRLAVGADVGDVLAGPHVLPDGDVVVVHVAVDGVVAVVVLDDHPQPEAVRRAGGHHHPVADRDDRRAHRAGQVDALVHHAPAHAEAGRLRPGARPDPGAQHGLVRVDGRQARAGLVGVAVWRRSAPGWIGRPVGRRRSAGWPARRRPAPRGRCPARRPPPCSARRRGRRRWSGAARPNRRTG